HEPRDRAISVPGIDVDDGAIWLDVGDAPASWPTIEIVLRGPQRLPVPVYKLWFRKSQNLGRIEPADSGFGPALTITSAFPFGVAKSSDTLAKKLDELPDDSRCLLRQWLEAVVIDVDDKNGTETIHLRSLPDGVHQGLSHLLAMLRDSAALLRED